MPTRTTILDRLTHGSPGDVRELVSGELKLEWSMDGLTVTRGSEVDYVDPDTLVVQPSRHAVAGEPSLADKLLGRLPPYQHWFGVEVRGAGGTLFRLQAPADDALLTGLPSLSIDAPRVALDAAVDCAATLRALGAQLASWTDADGVAAEQELRFADTGFLRRVVVVGLVWLVPLGLIALSGWLKVLSFVPGLIAYAAITAAIGLLGFDHWQLVKRTDGTWLRRTSRLGLGRSVRSVQEMAAVAVFCQKASAGRRCQVAVLPSDAIGSGPDRRRAARRRGAVLVHRALLPGGDDDALPSAAEQVSELTGLPIQRLDAPPLPAPGLSAASAVGLLVAALLVGGWFVQSRSVDGQVAQLGGWFTGHGDLASAVTGTFTYDYSLVSSPTRVSVVGLSRDGTAALSGEHNGASVRRWSVDSGWSESLETRTGQLAWLGFVDDGKTTVALFKEAILRWTPASDEPQILPAPWIDDILGEELRGCVATDGHLLVAYRGKGRRLKSGSNAPSGVQVVHLLDDEETWLSLPLESESALIFSPDCRALLVAHRRRLVVLDTATGQSAPFELPFEPQTTPEGAPMLALSEGGAWVAAAEGADVVVYGTTTETKKGRRLFSVFDPPPDASYPDAMLAFSPGGALVAISARSTGINAAPGVIRVVDPESGAVLAHYEGHGDAILSMAFSGDGSRLITGSRDQTARVWALP